MIELQAISGRLERGEIEGARYLEELMRYVTSRIGCSRAALRIFVEGGDPDRTLRSIALHDASTGRMTAAPDIERLQGGRYLERLQRDGSVTVADTLTDPLIVGSLRAYADATGVRSLLDVACSVNGSLFGAFSCEQIDTPVGWSVQQQQALRKIASRASLTLVNLVQAGADTAPGALWEISLPNRLATLPMPLDPLD